MSRTSHGILTRRAVAWAAWDWGSAAWNAVITTFVFTVYLTSSAFGSPEETSGRLSTGLTLAGILVALLAPISGQRSDRSGRTMRWLAITTGIVVVASALLVLVRPEPELLWLGVALVAGGTVVFEFAQVNYNALLPRVASPQTMGRVSGLGWGAGYLGGILLLLIVLIGFIRPSHGWFGVTPDEGMHVRGAMLLCAVWFGVFAVPVFWQLKDTPRAGGSASGQAGDPSLVAARRPRASAGGLLGSYRELWQTILDLRRHHPETLYFLAASAVFRDGLAGVFTFGGVIAAGSYGFSADTVIVFGVLANVVAGAATITGGLLDDRLGPKRIIVGSLAFMVLAGLGIFLGHDRGPMVFWVLGLFLAGFVGPAQSASRSLLARQLPAGREAEVFGLYATTGRAVSFLAPLCFALAIAVGDRVELAGVDAQHWGILGLILVLALGLLLVLPVRTVPSMATDPRHPREPDLPTPADHELRRTEPEPPNERL